MNTAVVDDKHRIRIPNLKPGQVLAYSNNPDGTVTLTPLKPDTKEPFPPGSLLKYVDEWNDEFGPVAKRMPIPPPPEEWE